ncbi:2356_t:CDS:2, partial [Cetraspora pellucida]
RNYAICCACYDTLGRPTALLYKFSNKNEHVKNHLKKWQHFINKVGGIEEVSKILEIKLEEVKEKSEIANAKKICVKSNISTDKKNFESLLLHATVSASLALQWIQNEEVQELFYFVNPSLKLPGCCSLGGRILNNEVKKYNYDMITKLKNNLIGPTLTFDG